MIERNLFYYRIFIIIFWIEACFGFVSEELLPFIHPLKSPLYFFFDIVLVLLGLATLKTKRDKIVLCAFLVIGIVSTLMVNGESVMSYINGSRQFIGVIFFIPIFRYLLTCSRGAEFREKIDKNLFIFLCLQTVCLTEQFIRYGANDHGGGTLGNGGSGVISTLICLLSFYFISKKWDSSNYLLSLKKNWLYIFLLYPIFLNETKASFIYLAVYFVLLYKFEMKSIGKMFIAAPLIVLCTYGLYGAYKWATNASDDVATEDYMTEYLVSTDLDELVKVAQAVQDGDIEPDGMWEVDIPRFAKLGLMPFVLSDTKGGNVLGAGLGQFKGGTTLGLTKFAAEYQWLLLGSVPMLMFVGLQLGIIGLIWFFYVMICHIISFSREDNEFERKMKLFLLAVLALSLFYNDMFQLAIFTSMYCYLAMVNTLKPEQSQEEQKIGL
jgi:hypothetical protein